MSASPPADSRVEVWFEQALPALRAENQPVNVRAAMRRGWYARYRTLVLAIDVIVITLTLVTSHIYRWGDDLRSSTTPEILAIPFIIGGAWLLMLSVVDSRSRKVVGAGMDEYRRVINASFLAFGAVAIGSYLVQGDISRFYFAMALPLGLFLLLLGRWAARAYLVQLRESGRAMVRTVIVGNQAQVVAAVRDLRRHPAAGFEPRAVCILDAADGQAPASELDGLGRVSYEKVGALANLDAVSAVLVAGGLDRRETRELAWHLERAPVELLFVPRLTDVSGPRIQMRSVQGLDLMQVDLPRFSGWAHRVKRTFDLVFSVGALVALSPLFAAVAVAIRLDDGGPVFFRQQRVGLKGEPFTIHKFRTMCVDAEAKLAELRAESTGNGVLFKMDEDPRVTRVGRFLRKYSLDELPQFWTSLMGGMSIVGPRPHLAHELAEFPNEGLRRLLIKPGITGPWQVSGRSDLSLEESIRLDLRYVENWSLSGDIAIILRTIKTVVRPAGAY